VVDKGSLTYFLNFGTPSISQKLLKLETSNLVNRLATSDPKQKSVKLGQKGPWRGHVTYFLNFGTPFISWEGLKLETSNLACRLAIGGLKRNNAKLGQKGSRRGHVSYFLNFETPVYLGNGWSSKLQIWHTDWSLGVLTKKCKIRSKGVVKGSRDLLLEFWDPLHISEMVEARNIKFGRQIGHWGVLTKKCKIRSNGAVKGSLNLLLEFRDPSISRERLKLEALNLAGRLDTGDTNETMQN